MKTITFLGVSSLLLLLLTQTVLLGDRDGSVGFGAPLQQSVNPAPTQTTSTTAPAPTVRNQRVKRGGNGNIQPGNGNQGPIAQGNGNHRGQNGNGNKNLNHNPGNNSQNPPITSATPPPKRHDWHDGDWWRHHVRVIVIVVGSYYYWDGGYWYPAYGYDPSNYYPSDDPIYAYGNLLPDQVIANVQRQLKLDGYYTGEINGSLDSTTRAAIANYQRDNGLAVTATADQATVESLGLV
jgi:putative peptidoglycan binding protein